MILMNILMRSPAPKAVILASGKTHVRKRPGGVPQDTQVSVQQAVEILGMPRPFLLRLLDGGEIPFRRPGAARKLALRDLLEYKRRRDRERHEAINRMARMEWEAGTYTKIALPDGAQEM